MAPTTARRNHRNRRSGAWRALACALMLLPVLVAGGERPPNVVIIELDDVSPRALGCYGSAVGSTPNLDALAARGMRCDATYIQGAHIGGVCLPSRGMLLTGRSWFRLPAGSRDVDSLAGSRTLPQAFVGAGYACMRAGKPGNQPRRISETYGHSLTTGDAASFADALIAFARKEGRERPFLLHLAATEPHDPQHAPAEWYARFSADAMPLPPAFRPLHPFDNGEMTVRDETTLPWPRTEAAVRGKLARYHASLAFVDAQIGRILAALAELGELERTLVVAIADNGLSLGDHGLLGKQNLYEQGGMHVPLILAGPGVRRGTTAALVYNLDVFPTLCELTGIAPPGDIDGRSFARVVRGESDAHHAAIVTGYRDVQRAVRDARWKLMRYPRIARTQLFDLAQDPHELNDLAGTPAHAEQERRLLELLERERHVYGDQVALTVAQPASGDWTPPTR